jgi:hypothetical protein
MTLDEIREAVERKYEPLTIPFGDGKTCTLRQPLRLSKEDRARLVKLQGSVNAEAETEEDLEQVLGALRDILKIAAANKADANALLRAVGDDELVLMEIVNKWTEGAQVGEASGSAS